MHQSNRNKESSIINLCIIYIIYTSKIIIHLQYEVVKIYCINYILCRILNF